MHEWTEEEKEEENARHWVRIRWSYGNDLLGYWASCRNDAIQQNFHYHFYFHSKHAFSIPKRVHGREKEKNGDVGQV